MNECYADLQLLSIMKNGIEMVMCHVPATHLQYPNLRPQQLHPRQYRRNHRQQPLHSDIDREIDNRIIYGEKYVMLYICVSNQVFR